MASDIKRGTETEDVSGQSAEDNIVKCWGGGVLNQF
jgi:hypothetical protein